MSHLFISYSHQDDEYVNRLAQALEQEGFLSWVDNRIDYGTTWTGEVQRRLDECAAFLLIMTPRSFESRWVNNELSRAMRKNKPIFPLLLEGDEPWLAVESIQFLDVRGEKLPDERFYQQLATVVERKKSPLEPIPEPIPEALPLSLPIEEIPPVDVPAKQESTKPKFQPEVNKPVKAVEKQSVSKPVVMAGKERIKPGKAPKISRPVQIFTRKWMIWTGITLGVILLGTSAWFLREPLGLVPSPQSTRTTTHTRSSPEVDTPPPTTTAGMTALLPIGVGNADQVGQVMQWGSGDVINTMVKDWNGERVAVGTSKGVKILDAITLEVISTFDYGDPVTALAFTKEGNTLAVGFGNGSVMVVTMTGTEVFQFDAGSRVNSLAFDEWGKWLAAGLEDGSFMIWLMEDGSLVDQMVLSYPITRVLLTGDQLLTGTAGSELSLWKWNPIELVESYEAPPEGILSLAFSPDRNMLAAGCADGYIRIWDGDTGEVQYELDGMTDRVQAIAYSPDGYVLVSGTEEGKIYLWKLTESQEPVEMLDGYHTLRILNLAFPQNDSLISIGDDGKVLRWDLDTLTPSAENTDFSQANKFISLSPDNTSLAYAVLEGDIYIGDITRENPSIVLKGPPDSFGIELISDGKTVITVSSECIMRETENSSPVKVVDGMPAEVTSAAFHPDRDEVAVGFADATIRFYDFNGVLLDAWSTDQAENGVTLLEYSPDGRLLAASYDDGLLVIWQKIEPRKLYIFTDAGMTAFAFTPDSSTLLMVGEDGSLFTLAMESGTAETLDLSTRELGTNVVTMEFSPDGSILTLGLKDNRIALVDYYEKKVLTYLDGHALDISSLTWLQDASMLISSSLDGTIRFWGVRE